MRNFFTSLGNIAVTMVLLAFLLSALPATVFAKTLKIDTGSIHAMDSQFANHPVHQKTEPCDDGCCVTHSHCFCAGYAVPASQAFVVPLILYSAAMTFHNQKGEGTLTLPQLRPPKELA